MPTKKSTHTAITCHTKMPQPGHRTVPDPAPRLSKSKPKPGHKHATHSAPRGHRTILNLGPEFKSQFRVQTAYKTVITGYGINHKVVSNPVLNSPELNYTHWPTKPSISPYFSIQTTLKLVLNSPKNGPQPVPLNTGPKRKAINQSRKIPTS